MKSVFILTVFLMSFSSVAVAQDTATGGGDVVLMELTATERMSRGKLDSCELTYYLAFEDYIYRNGAITILRGSVNFTGFINDPEGSPAFLFKATAFDFDGENNKLSPLEYIYLASEGVSYAGKEFAIGAAEDGGMLVGYQALDNLSLNFLSPMSFNILRQGGGSDVSIPVNFLVQKPDVSMQYYECSIKLLDAISRKFK